MWLAIYENIVLVLVYAMFTLRIYLGKVTSCEWGLHTCTALRRPRSAKVGVVEEGTVHLNID